MTECFERCGTDRRRGRESGPLPVRIFLNLVRSTGFSDNLSRSEGEFTTGRTVTGRAWYPTVGDSFSVANVGCLRAPLGWCPSYY